MISLAITNFNRSDSVIESFVQVLNNDFISEIVIVDDYSDALSYISLWNLINNLNNDKIKLHRNDANLKPFRNKYEAVKKCSNDWVILLDSDNIIANDYIKIVKHLDRKDDIIYNPETLYSANKKSVDWCYKDFNKVIIDKSNVKKYMELPNFGTFLNTGNYFFNRNKYLQIIEGCDNDVKLSVNDAIYFSYLWLLNGNRIKVVPDLSYIHRATEDSWWSINSEKCILAASEIIKRIEKW